MSLRVYLARIKRRFFKKPFFKDPNFPSYWFLKGLGDKEASIVQIGSNDGKTGDPLNKLFQLNKQWSGLFVEPVAYIFDQLKKNYPNESRFRFENVAINDGSKLKFYWVALEAKRMLKGLPYWYDQLGSFDKSHIVDVLGDKITPYILNKELEGITLSDLLERNQIQKIDLLHIDAEGYDWKILSQLDLNTFDPAFILFETNHLSDMELLEAESFLKNKFVLYQSGIDTLAVNRKIVETSIPNIAKYFSLFSTKKEK